jgi:O-antigen ligase
MFSITSRGAPAGLFANENHSAVFSALVLLVIARIAVEGRSAQNPAWLRLAQVPAFIFILLAVLVTGSRAGYVSAIFALLGAGAMALVQTRKPSAGTRHRSKGRALPDQKGVLGWAFGGLLIGVIGAFIWLERTPAVEDIMAQNAFEDLRWSLWPVLSEMMGTHWQLGTGFGSFDAVYRIYEPTELLLPPYVNHAHNDWAQLIIEAGLPGAALLIAGVVWLSKTLWSLAHQSANMLYILVFWVTCLVIICAASLVDYPLRTPIFQCVFIWLLASLAFDLERVRSRPFLA